MWFLCVLMMRFQFPSKILCFKINVWFTSNFNAVYSQTRWLQVNKILTQQLNTQFNKVFLAVNIDADIQMLALQTNLQLLIPVRGWRVSESRERVSITKAHKNAPPSPRNHMVPFFCLFIACLLAPTVLNIWFCSTFFDN